MQEADAVLRILVGGVHLQGVANFVFIRDIINAFVLKLPTLVDAKWYPVGELMQRLCAVAPVGGDVWERISLFVALQALNNAILELIDAAGAEPLVFDADLSDKVWELYCVDEV